MTSKKRLIGMLALASLLLPFPSNAQEDGVLAPGLYRLEMIMASVARLPFFGSSKSASKSTSLVQIRRDGSAWVQSHEVCDFRVLEDSAMIKLIFPEQFIASLAKHTYAIELRKDDQGWRYRADLGIERIGYKSHSTEDKLPSRIDDPSVFDWDSDGHPGATLKLSVPLLPDGELYIVQTGHSVLNGRIKEEGKIEGDIEVQNFQQRVLGARPGFLNRSPDIKADPKASRFIITPVDPGTTCQSLRSDITAPQRRDGRREGASS